MGAHPPRPFFSVPNVTAQHALSTATNGFVVVRIYVPRTEGLTLAHEHGHYGSAIHDSQRIAIYDNM